MDYELALKLKEAGFPQKRERIQFIPSNYSRSEPIDFDQGMAAFPTLSELIEACGDIRFDLFGGYGDGWWAFKDEAEEDKRIQAKGSTPEEAVANLWLALQGKK